MSYVVFLEKKIERLESEARRRSSSSTTDSSNSNTTPANDPSCMGTIASPTQPVHTTGISPLSSAQDLADTGSPDWSLDGLVSPMTKKNVVAPRQSPEATRPSHFQPSWRAQTVSNSHTKALPFLEIPRDDQPGLINGAIPNAFASLGDPTLPLTNNSFWSLATMFDTNYSWSADSFTMSNTW